MQMVNIYSRQPGAGSKEVMECKDDLITDDEGECDSDMITDNESFHTISSGCGEETSLQLPGQTEMDQLNMCMTELTVEDDTKPAPGTLSNKKRKAVNFYSVGRRRTADDDNSNQKDEDNVAQPNPILLGVMNVKGYRKCVKNCVTYKVVSIEPEGQKFSLKFSDFENLPFAQLKGQLLKNVIYLISCSACD